MVASRTYTQRLHQSNLRLEPLENRLALAGLVTAEFLAPGDLVVRGDQESNEIAVYFEGGNIAVTGLDGSTQINGEIQVHFPQSQLTGDLRIDMRSGDNVVRVGGASHDAETPDAGDGSDQGHEEPRLFVPGHMVIRGGAGNDTVAISFVEIGGRLSIDTFGGDDIVDAGRGPGFGHEDHGDDHLTVDTGNSDDGVDHDSGCDGSDHGGPPPDVHVAQDVFVNTGPGGDQVKFAFAEVGAGIRLLTGPGADYVVTGRGPIHGTHGPGGEGGCGDTGHDGGCDGGHDGGCSGSDHGGGDEGHTSDSGGCPDGDGDDPHGDDGCGGGSGGGSPNPQHRPVDLRVGENLRMDLGPNDDVVTMRNTRVEGDLEIAALPGNDAIAAQNLRLHGDATIRTMAGDDVVAIMQSTFKGLLAISTGSGNDLVLIAGSKVEGRLELDTGAQADTVLLTSSSFLGPVALNGGEDLDTLFRIDLTMPPELPSDETSFERYHMDAAAIDVVLARIDDLFGGFLQGRHQVV